MQVHHAMHMGRWSANICNDKNQFSKATFTKLLKEGMNARLS